MFTETDRSPTGETLIPFIHELDSQNIPATAISAARVALLDLTGVAAAGSRTELSRIICAHAVTQFGAPGATPGARILFTGLRCSPVGAALAGGMMIDSVDAHDGHKLTKGHVGCGVLPALLAMSEATSLNDEDAFISALVMGYEIGTRAGIALHRTSCDYHTSGAWIAIAAAAISSRLLGLDHARTREALGIAEYHGPRSQMMRCIDHPTMLKDGSGWGAMAGVSAAFLAQNGFTGAPAITTEQPEVEDLWSDLGSTWRVCEQYLKPYPVCRWAQPGIIAALGLLQLHKFDPNRISSIEIGTFHESKRLDTREPTTTEQAQYSLPFPVATALVHGDVDVRRIEGPGLLDQQVLSVSRKISVVEVEQYNAQFPRHRFSHVNIKMDDGSVLESGPTEAAGDPEMPLPQDQVIAKFNRFAGPVLGESADAIRCRIEAIGIEQIDEGSGNMQDLYNLIYAAPTVTHHP